jgi:RecA/RadA recombinase
MAKKDQKGATGKKQFSFTAVTDILKGISKSVPIQIDNEIREKKYISTGVYLLDASLSTHLLNGGIESGKIFCLAGESGTGKSFIALSIAKQAQQQGYGVIYIDTEYAITLGDLPNYGIDIAEDKFTLVRTNKVEDINIALTQLIDTLKQKKMEGEELQPMLIVLDSVGAMSSNKEKNDLVQGNIKQDMTRAKSLAALFRSITSDLGYCDIPMVVCNHVYLSQDLFPQEILKGGNGLKYHASTIGMMSKAKLKNESEMDEMDLGQSGIIVSFKTAKNRLAKPKKIKFEVSFNTGLNKYSGLDAFCRPEYFSTVGIAQGKMLVDKKTGEMTFQPGGNRWYVNHLDKSVSIKQLFTDEVFNEKVLKALDPILHDYFKYKSIDELEELNKQFEQAVAESEDDGEDSLDAKTLFS